MKYIIKTLIILAVGGAIAFYATVHSTARHADMVLLNGIIYTLDEHNTVAQAVAISGNRIVATGSTEDIKHRYADAAQVIDLEGKTVMPGFIDGHAHILNLGKVMFETKLFGTTSADEAAKLIGEKAGSAKEGEWILGRGWDQNDWDVKEFPSHDILDKVAPNNPVVLQRVDGHALWVNQQALSLAGITAETQDPQGGKMYRDAKGNPTGIFVDAAMDLIYKVVPHFTDEEAEVRLKAALAECVKNGLTQVHDFGGAFDTWGVDLQTIKIYKKLIDNGECPIRIYAGLDPSETTWGHYLETGPEIGYGNGMLTARTIKLYMDGALGSRGAALIDEYSDDPGNRGVTRLSEADLDKICETALQAGFQVCIHAIGDRANHIILNEYEKVLKNYPANKPSPRWRIEHAQVIAPEDISRFAQIGILPSLQPTHATSDMYWAEARLGPQRVKGAYAWKSLINSGSHIIGGSDFPVENVSPLLGFYAAATRSDKSGYPQDGWMREQKMTREEAARCFTQWAAYGSFEERVKGTIEPGKWADFTILSKDIMTIPQLEILSTDVDMTIVGGKIVYQKTINQ